MYRSKRYFSWFFEWFVCTVEIKRRMTTFSHTNRNNAYALNRRFFFSHFSNELLWSFTLTCYMCDYNIEKEPIFI